MAKTGVPSIHPLKSIEKRMRDMLAVNATVPQIAEVVEVSEATLYRHYNHIIKKFDRTPGPKPHEPTDELRKTVRLYSGIKVAHDHIAKMIGVCPATLRKYYSEELELGSIEADAKVAANIWAMATGPKDSRNTALMAKFWAGVHLKWVEVSRIEQTGPDGGPIKTENQVVVILPSNGRDAITIDSAAAIEADEADDEAPPPVPSDEAATRVQTHAPLPVADEADQPPLTVWDDNA